MTQTHIKLVSEKDLKNIPWGRYSADADGIVNIAAFLAWFNSLASAPEVGEAVVCQYGKDIGMPEYSCVNKCVYSAKLPKPDLPGDDGDITESAYWQFDAMHKGYGEYKGLPLSERDAFKRIATLLISAGKGNQPDRTAQLEDKIKRLVEKKDNAYFERNQCVALIARMALSLGWDVAVTKTTIDGWSSDWHGCVYIKLPSGQVSWHFHDSHAYLFEGLPIKPTAWDGHDTEEKYRRVNSVLLANMEAKG